MQGKTQPMQALSFEKITLSNGLTVISHYDPLTPMVVVNTLYKVGARQEDPNRTGFAHLFEHLMFGGSLHAPQFDTALQLAGGNNNAFTNNDITNYYDILPADNVETAFWLESDRMAFLNITERSLDIQRKVVIEEFKENYLNQPYGQLWHQVRALSYDVHPYRWPTIGLTPQHVADATLADVQHFFDRYYQPGNAILSVAGGVKPDRVFDLAEKYFGSIPAGPAIEKTWAVEPDQEAPRYATFEDEVPLNALIFTFPMAERNADEYYQADLLSDVLSSGTSARLYQRLVKDQQLFNQLNAFVTNNVDPGLFVVYGRLNDGIAYKQAKEAISQELQGLQQESIPAPELQKIKNKVESGYEYNTISLMNRAYSLAYFDMLDNAGRINEEKDRYLSVTAQQLKDQAQKLFASHKLNTIEYRAKTASYA